MNERRKGVEPDGRSRICGIMDVPAAVALLLLRVYKRVVSPWLPVACRFHPTCSEYAMEAIRIHGLLRGGCLACRRLLRCHPFASGGYDPVPSPRKEDRNKAA